MATREQSVQVVDNREASRYEMTLDGISIGYIDYRISGDVIVMSYIQIEPEFGGRGFGGRLTQAALDDARGRKLTVVPTCPFIVDYVRNHPEQPAPRDER